jgi:hypothetical protein
MRDGADDGECCSRDCLKGRGFGYGISLRQDIPADGDIKYVLSPQTCVQSSEGLERMHGK